MKIIIAGGRDYKPPSIDELLMETTVAGYKERDLPVTEIVSGCARGADRFGEQFANRMGVPIKRFPADWSKHGKAAGPIRNRQMAEYADALILFKGGTGSISMLRAAEKAQIEIFCDETMEKFRDRP